MAVTGTILPLGGLVSQLSWNALTDWAGYFKYQESARAVELLREDIGGDAPIARIYERLRRGQNLAQTYTALTGRSFDDFVAGLSDRMRAAVPAGQGLVAVAPTSYLIYGFPPASTITITVSGPRGSESSPMVVSPFGSNFDGIAETRLRGGYTISAQTDAGVFTVKIRKESTGQSSDYGDNGHSSSERPLASGTSRSHRGRARGRPGAGVHAGPSERDARGGAASSLACSRPDYMRGGADSPVASQRSTFGM